jgi:RNA polymerase sigma-70 factor (ECF subfamily)
MDSDEELMVYYSTTGNREASEELYRRCFRPLCAYLRQFVQAADAEDLAQAAFIRAFDRAHQFDPTRGSFRVWLFAIGFRLFLNFRNRPRREVQFFEGAGPGALTPDQISASDLPPDEKVARLELVSVCLQKLPERERAMLLLCHGEGFTIEEARQIVGIGAYGTAGRVLHIARNLMRQYLKDQGFHG